MDEIIDPLIGQVLEKSEEEIVRFSNEKTIGGWGTEEDAAAAFDNQAAIVSERGYWRVYSEVRGEYIQPRMFSDETKSRCRADRIILPSQKLVDLGWPHGPIGIEIEPSRTPISRPLTQVEGYSRAIWHLPNGFHILPEWWFIWCWAQSLGNVDSIAAQKRIGGVCYDAHNVLKFWTGSSNGLVFTKAGNAVAKRMLPGGKAGHR